MPTALELRDERARLVGEARTLSRKAEEEKRALTNEEAAQFDRIMDAVDAKKVEIDRVERLERSEHGLDESRGRKTEAGKTGAGGNDGKEERKVKTAAEYRATEKYGKAYDEFLMYGQRDMSAAAHEAFREHRGMQADVNLLGGFLTTPKKMVDDLIQAVDNLVFVRNWATKYQVDDAQSLGAPSLDTDIDDADWTSELSIGSETTPNFGDRELHPKDLSKLCKVSLKLLRLSSKGPAALINQRMSYKFGVTQERAFLSGNGVKQPLGVYTASADGVTTSQDVTCGSAAGSAINANGLIDMKYALKAQYLRDASLRWLFHRDGVKLIRKLTYTGSGEYVWQPGLQKGEPDLILDIPYEMSEYNPNTYTQNSYVCMLAAWKNYWIADGPSLAIQRLDELYAATNQVGFIGRMAIDGMPVLAEAFVRGKVGA